MKFNLIVVGSRWTIRVLPRKKYNRKQGKDSLAMTVFHKRRVDLSPSGCTQEVIIHELVHCYLYECCLYDRDEMDVHTLEETFCELMAKFGLRILRQARELQLKIDKAHSKPSERVPAQRSAA